MSTEAFDLTTFLPYQLAVLSERVSKALSVVYMEEYGLSVADWRVMVHTAKEGSVSVREIHRTVNLEKPRVSRSVAKLEALGYLGKQIDPKDKRLVVISLTARGQEVLDDILPKAQAFERDLINALSPGSLEDLAEIADRLHHQLDKMGAKGNDPRAPLSSTLEKL